MTAHTDPFIVSFATPRTLYLERVVVRVLWCVGGEQVRDADGEEETVSYHCHCKSTGPRLLLAWIAIFPAQREVLAKRTLQRGVTLVNDFLLKRTYPVSSAVNVKSSMLSEYCRSMSASKYS